MVDVSLPELATFSSSGQGLNSDRERPLTITTSSSFSTASSSSSFLTSSPSLISSGLSERWKYRLLIRTSSSFASSSISSSSVFFHSLIVILRGLLFTAGQEEAFFLPLFLLIPLPFPLPPLSLCLLPLLPLRLYTIYSSELEVSPGSQQPLPSLPSLATPPPPPPSSSSFTAVLFRSFFTF